MEAAVETFFSFYLQGVLAVLAAGGLGAWIGYRTLSCPVDPRRLKTVFFCLWFGAAGLWAALAVRSLWTYHKYFDTAVEVQTIHNIALGRGPISSINAECMSDPDRNASYFSYHACLAYYPTALLYRLFPSAPMLVALGAVCVALGAVVVFRLTLSLLGATWPALIPPLAYLLYPTVQYAALWEFHALSLAVPCLAWALLAVWKERPAAFWIWGLLALSVREDVALMGVLLGFFAAWRAGPMRRHGIAFTILALAHFWTATHVWMPILSSRQEWWQMRMFSHLGGSTLEIARTVFTRPGVVAGMLGDATRWGNAALFFLPFLFLPLLAGRWTLLFLPYFGLLFVGRDLAFYSIFLYYSVPLAPSVAASAAVVLGRLRARRPALSRTAAGGMLGASLAQSVLFGAGPGSIQFWRQEWTLARFREPYFHRENYILGPHERAAARILAMIKPSERVGAAHYFLPHLVRCERVYLLHSAARLPDDVDTAVYDATRANAYMACGYDDLRRDLTGRGFSVAAEDDGVVLMRR